MLFTEVQLFSYLVTLGAETASTVKELTEGDDLAVYEGAADYENDLRVKEKYRKAIEACEIWLKAVLSAEIMENKRNDISAEISLLLPDDFLEIAVCSSKHPFKSSKQCEHSEGLKTIIGVLDYFTYRAIVDIPLNPVKVLFRYFHDLIHQIHGITTMPNHCNGQDDLLNKYIVEEEGIVDVLGVSKYDGMWYRLNEFLSDMYSGNEVA